MASELTNMAQAASILSKARRVLVIGCSGGGKTTLARWLSARFDLPFVSMDQEFFWLPGWVSRPRTEQRALIAAKIDEPRWVMDGTNPSSFDLRLPRTDVVIWVRMPRLLCLWGVAGRKPRSQPASGLSVRRRPYGALETASGSSTFFRVVPILRTWERHERPCWPWTIQQSTLPCCSCALTGSFEGAVAILFVFRKGDGNGKGRLRPL